MGVLAPRLLNSLRNDIIGRRGVEHQKRRRGVWRTTQPSLVFDTPLFLFAYTRCYMQVFEAFS